MTIDKKILLNWNLTPVKYIGIQRNEHWLVRRAKSNFILRAYSPGAVGIDFEHEVLKRLHNMGWMVPTLAEEPISSGGRTWCLFNLLKGESRALSTRQEQRVRGRFLAELHESMSQLELKDQRPGCQYSDELTDDPELLTLIKSYEEKRPIEGHILRWHLDKVRKSFQDTQPDREESIIIHSDFARWNLLFEDKHLSGILDFESTHRNYRVADFALSWRGTQDGVIEGYQEVSRLSEYDMELLVPVFWAWLFIGLKNELQDMLDGRSQCHGFYWQIKHLLIRTPLFGKHSVPYPSK